MADALIFLQLSVLLNGDKRCYDPAVALAEVGFTYVAYCKETIGTHPKDAFGQSPVTDR